MRNFLDRPQSVFARRALFQVHLWSGVLIGLYIFVVCASGAALVFRIDMQRALHPALFTPFAPGPVADPVAVMESVRKAYPSATLSGVDAPTTSRPTYLAYAGRGDRFLTLLLDPVSAELLGELPERSFVRTLQDLHFDLLAGRNGRLVNGVGALFLLAMCLTGLVIWWPGRSNWKRGFTVDFSRQWKRVNWDLHSAVGIWTVALVAMWAITGVYFAFPAAFRSTVNRISPVTVARPPQSDPSRAAQSRPSWRRLVDEARRRVPGQYVARVVVPSSRTAAFLVMFSAGQPTPAGSTDLTSVYLDQYTGAVLAEPAATRRTTGDVVMAWVAPLHVGNFGGNAVRVAWLLLGMAPAVLFVTGFIMWWTRVVRPRWIRLSQPAEEAQAAKQFLNRRREHAIGNPSDAAAAGPLFPYNPPRGSDVSASGRARGIHRRRAGRLRGAWLALPASGRDAGGIRDRRPVSDVPRMRDSHRRPGCRQARRLADSCCWLVVRSRDCAVFRQSVRAGTEPPYHLRRGDPHRRPRVSGWLGLPRRGRARPRRRSAPAPVVNRRLDRRKGGSS